MGTDPLGIAVVTPNMCVSAGPVLNVATDGTAARIEGRRRVDVIRYWCSADGELGIERVKVDQ